MYLEVLTVSVGYSDYLKHCLPNRQLFDRWIIVTTEEDTETIELCKEHNIEYVFTHRLYEHGAAFSKGKAINDGLKHLSKQDWILLLDSDIVLPSDFRNHIQHIDPEYLYSIRSRNIAMHAAHLQENVVTPHTDTALAQQNLAPGFFQLFHSSNAKPYPEYSSNATGDDMAFAKLWPREKRVLLDIPCTHIGLPMHNWNARSTKDFSCKPNLWSIALWKMKFAWSQCVIRSYTVFPPLYHLKNTVKKYVLRVQKGITKNEEQKKRIENEIMSLVQRKQN